MNVRGKYQQGRRCSAEMCVCVCVCKKNNPHYGLSYISKGCYCCHKHAKTYIQNSTNYKNTVITLEYFLKNKYIVRRVVFVQQIINESKNNRDKSELCSIL